MEQIIVPFLLAIVAVVNLMGFTLMGIDKRKAIRHAWRIPERTLILTAVLGGGIGSYLGMILFRHKTKHNKFRIILPLTALLDLAIIVKMVMVIWVVTAS